MRCWVAVLLVTLTCLGTGCAKYYYQEGKSFTECKKDCVDCMAELSKRLAQRLEDDRDLSLTHRDSSDKRLIRTGIGGRFSKLLDATLPDNTSSPYGSGPFRRPPPASSNSTNLVAVGVKTLRCR